MKEAGADDRVVDHGPFAERHQDSTDHANSPTYVKIFFAERDIGKQRRGLHRGQLLYAVEHGIVEGGVVSIERTNRIYSKGKQMVGPKTQVGVREVQEGAGQQTGSNQKDH